MNTADWAWTLILIYFSNSHFELITVTLTTYPKFNKLNFISFFLSNIDDLQVCFSDLLSFFCWVTEYLMWKSLGLIKIKNTVQPMKLYTNKVYEIYQVICEQWHCCNWLHVNLSISVSFIRKRNLWLMKYCFISKKKYHYWLFTIPFVTVLLFC